MRFHVFVTQVFPARVVTRIEVLQVKWGGGLTQQLRAVCRKYTIRRIA